LHDIGKGAETDSDQNHAEVGAEMARKMGEEPRVVNAIAAHHNDVEPQTTEAVIYRLQTQSVLPARVQDAKL